MSVLDRVPEHLKEDYTRLAAIVDDAPIEVNDRGNLEYKGDTFSIELYRYSDPDRLSLADSAAYYLGKPDHDNTRRPLSIMRMGHALEIFRGENATFVFKGVSKEVYDHLCTYKTMNMRVAGGNRALTSDDFTMPSDKMKNPALVELAISNSMNEYRRLLKAGETPQVARAAMPVNAQLNPFKLQFNFQTLIQALFVQRIFELGAQGNTVKVVRGMFALVHRVDPELWETVYECYGHHVKEWTDVQKRLRKRPITVSEFIDMVLRSDKLPEIAKMPLEQFLREEYGAQKTMW